MTLYKNLAKDFAESRPVIQPGWQELSKLDMPHEFNVLDVGCANGRLYPFLQLYFPDRFDYLGLDNSPELLNMAKQESYPRASYMEFDLSSPTTELQKLLAGQTFDLLAVYATMHHIPHFAQRQTLLQELATHVAAGGYLHVSFWQFGEFNRYHRKIGFSPELVGMRAEDLEPGDYIMNWERGGTAYRFCHWARSEEVEKYNQTILATGMKLKKTYRADGKENNQNLYYLWQKS